MSAAQRAAHVHLGILISDIKPHTHGGGMGRIICCLVAAVLLVGRDAPAGYIGVTDKADKSMADAKYTAKGSQWEVQTGPAHILYAAKDSAAGVYAVSATIQQLEKPTHPEAYGLFFGGSGLSSPGTQKYGYFVVRGSGEYLIKTRDGTTTKDVAAWQASPNVPKEDGSGKGTYKLTVHFAPDTAHFLVNDKLVAAVPRSQLPSAGIAGLRINHNLHLLVSPVSVSH